MMVLLMVVVLLALKLPATPLMLLAAMFPVMVQLVIVIVVQLLIPPPAFVRPGLSTWYYAFNHDRRAFDGPGQIPLKKAINFAIDRARIAGTVFKGTLQEPRGIVPAGLPGFQENLCLELCSYSPERARSLAGKVAKKKRSKKRR